MDCYSNENLHVLLKQEVGAYATYDYLRGMTSEDRLQNNHPKEEVNHGSTSHDEDDEDPGRTGSVSRKRKRISPKMMTTHADIDLIIKARRDRQVWRQRVCLWFYAVVDHIGMSREVVTVAMNLLDRYSATIQHHEETSGWMKEDVTLDTIFKHDFQLTSMTCLWIASKLFGRQYIPSSSSVVLVGDEEEDCSTVSSSWSSILRLRDMMTTKRWFSMIQLDKKEREILTTLSWKVHPPTPQAFLSLLTFELNRKTLQQQKEPLVSVEVEDLATYLIELAVTDYCFVMFKPSEVAYASLLHAIELRTNSTTRTTMEKWIRQLFSLLPCPAYTTTTTPRVMECRKRLESMYRTISGPMMMDGEGTPPPQEEEQDKPSSSSSCHVNPVLDSAPSMASPISVTDSTMKELEKSYTSIPRDE